MTQVARLQPRRSDLPKVILLVCSRVRTKCGCCCHGPGPPCHTFGPSGPAPGRHPHLCCALEPCFCVHTQRQCCPSSSSQRPLLHSPPCPDLTNAAFPYLRLYVSEDGATDGSVQGLSSVVRGSPPAPPPGQSHRENTLLGAGLLGFESQSATSCHALEPSPRLLCASPVKSGQ